MLNANNRANSKGNNKFNMPMPAWIILIALIIAGAYYFIHGNSKSIYGLYMALFFVVFSCIILIFLRIKHTNSIFDDKAHTLLLSGIILVVSMPLILSSPALFPILSFQSNKSDIADIINGYTAPVIGVLNAILLYFTFKNLLHQRNEDIKTKEVEYLINQLSEKISNFRYREVYTTSSSFLGYKYNKRTITNEYIGSLAFYKLFKYWYCYSHNEMFSEFLEIAKVYITEVESILNLIEYIGEKLDSDSLPVNIKESHKKMIANIFKHQVAYYLFETCNTYNITLEKYKCDDCSARDGMDVYHGFDDNFIKLWNNILIRYNLQEENNIAQLGTPVLIFQQRLFKIVYNNLPFMLRIIAKYIENRKMY